MNNYLDKLPQVVFDKIMLYNSHPVSDLFKKELDAALKELDVALKEHYSEDDPIFFTFYDYALYINRCEKEEREEREQREREHRYNSDSDPY